MISTKSKTNSNTYICQLTSSLPSLKVGMSKQP